jgi:hypothetical protein
VIKDIVVAVNEWKLQHVRVVTFHSKLILKHEYNHCKVVSERNEFNESYFGAVY